MRLSSSPVHNVFSQCNDYVKTTKSFAIMTFCLPLVMDRNVGHNCAGWTTAFSISVTFLFFSLTTPSAHFLPVHYPAGLQIGLTNYLYGIQTQYPSWKPYHPWRTVKCSTIRALAAWLNAVRCVTPEVKFYWLRDNAAASARSLQGRNAASEHSYRNSISYLSQI